MTNTTTQGPLTSGYYADDEIRALTAEFDSAFAALRRAGLEANADDLIAKRYRDASDAVNHANRKRDFFISTNQPYVTLSDTDRARLDAAMVVGNASALYEVVQNMLSQTAGVAHSQGTRHALADLTNAMREARKDDPSTYNVWSRVGNVIDTARQAADPNIFA
jgi:hypothetical protein